MPKYYSRAFTTLLGDFTANATLLDLMDNTTVNGQAAAFYFDGTYTNVVVVPEPGSLLLFGLGAAGLLGAIRRRRGGTPEGR